MGISSAGLTDQDTEVLADGRIGSVILLGTSRAGAASIRGVVERVRSAAVAPNGIQPMLTVDQEGGQVQRLRGPGFDRMPSARRQAELSDSQLTRRAERWGRQLKEAGIDADLAPVADVVPRDFEGVNEPVALLDRGFGPDPAVVSAKTSAVVHGMSEAGIATAVKHFPGLGQVRGNTDFTERVVDRTTKRGDPTLSGFRAGVAAGVDMVMVSSAYYEQIDPTRRAAFSSIVVQDMIRMDLGFSGVVVSDDLAARAVRDLTPGERALRFLRAGGDLVIVGQSSLAAVMVDRVLAEMEAEPDLAAAVLDKVSRVLAMKERRGLASCR